MINGSGNNLYKPFPFLIIRFTGKWRQHLFYKNKINALKIYSITDSQLKMIELQKRFELKHLALFVSLTFACHLTVAGEATSRSMGSKIRLICGDIWMISPLMRQSFLLSSSTVFMFSIHTASTGPSKISHFLSGLCWGGSGQSDSHWKI